jgi:hypothetical protein
VIHCTERISPHYLEEFRIVTTVPLGALLDDLLMTCTYMPRLEISPAAVGVLTPTRLGNVTKTEGHGKLWVFDPLYTYSGMHTKEEGDFPSGT